MAHFADNVECGLVALRHVLDDGQPQACATRFARSTFVHPVKAFSNTRQVLSRDAGASKVFLASAAPPVRFPNVYGIDMPTREELVAHGRSTEEICQLIGCDALIYQDVEAMKQAIGQLNAALPGFDASCFDGIYVTGDITEETLARMQQERRAAEAAQAAKQEDADA